MESLRVRGASGMPDECWRMQYTILGIDVCRDAFATVAGVGSSTLHATRSHALAGLASWSPRAERGLRGGVLSNANAAAAYFGARQWLEWYADSHAEMSPLGGTTYLSVGRKPFYCAHCRKDILGRHGIREPEPADARA